MTPSAHRPAHQAQAAHGNRTVTSANTDIPLGIWLCSPGDTQSAAMFGDAARSYGGALSPLVARILAEFAKPSTTILASGPHADSIAHAARSYGEDHVAVRSQPTVTTCKEQSAQTGTSVGGEPITVPGTVDLAVATSDPFDDPSKISALCQSWATALRPGGIAVVITDNPAGPTAFANQAGAVVAAARDGGLAYRQHVVAVIAHVRGDRLLIPQRYCDLPPGAPGDTIHLPVHLDLLIFQRNATCSADGGVQ